MGKLKGITVTVIEKIEAGKDPFGTPIYAESEVEIQNVLVSPSTTQDVIDQLSLTGKKVSYTLAIPKKDTHKWVNTKVKFYGETWQTVGYPIEGIEELIPLDWNKKVMVERYG
ncbi:hypothetical protein [Lactococcus fujiensis]|uniref:hypothetical protein n=1 Tax=Lactococcus fujiensis TaxID=610251 RepID=UPI0006D21BFE|nr:hypothetical protein [Lactococcus fujiensis]